MKYGVLYLFSIIFLLASPFGMGNSPAIQAAKAQSSTNTISNTVPFYDIIDLGTLGGDTTAVDIDETGRVTGYSEILPVSDHLNHAFIWQNGTMTDLGTLGGVYSYGRAINNSGQVVGYSLVGNTRHAFLWQNGSMQDLLTLGGPESFAWDISDSGKVVGEAHYDATATPHAVVWDNGISDLGIGDISRALAISDNSEFITGFKTPGQAWIWDNGVVTPTLGTLGGSSTSPYAVNSNGQVVGYSYTSAGLQRAFLWEDGVMLNLGFDWAFDINDLGQVVGTQTVNSALNAVLWENGQLTNLNTLIPAGSGWILQFAQAINDQGEIVGFGTKTGLPGRRGFILKPLTYINDLTSTPGVAKNAATLIWTAPYADFLYTALAYDLRYRNTPIDEANWSSATQVNDEPVPATPGSTEIFTVPSLANGTRWYFALKYQLPDLSWSPLSNVPSLLDIGFRPLTDGYTFSNYGDTLSTDLTITDTISLFNSQIAVCFNSTGSCNPRPAAEQFRQASINSTVNGHCEGISISALRFYTNLDNPVSLQSGAAVTHDLTKSNARGNIMYYFTPQRSDPVRAYKTQQVLKTPSQNLDELITSLTGPSPSRMNMVVRTNGGHAITPFAVEQRRDDWRVWVYDNNYPEISGTVSITTTVQSWSYTDANLNVYSGNPGNQTINRGMGVIPISQSALPMSCPWCPAPSPIRPADPSNTQSTGSAELWLVGGGHLLLTDTQNRRLGYLGNQFVDEIPGTQVGPIDGGLAPIEPIYTLPLTDTYTIHLDGQTLIQPGSSDLLQFGLGYATGARNIGVTPNTFDTLVIAPDGLQVLYQPNHAKSVDLLLALEESSTQGYTFKLAGVDLAAGQSASALVNFASGQLSLDNLAGADGVYNLDIRRVNVSDEWTFFHPGINVLAGDIHYMDFGSWDGSGMINLLIDHGGNGSIDQTVPLTNQNFQIYLPFLKR